MAGDPTRGPGPRKHRLRVGDLAILIALLAADFALFRAALAGALRESVGPFFGLAPLVGLLAIGVGFVRRYCPRRWERIGYAGAYLLYVVALGLYIVALIPALATPLAKTFGLQ